MPLFDVSRPLEKHRDALGLNDPDTLSMLDGSQKARRAAASMALNELKAGLSQLPAPQNEYQVEPLSTLPSKHGSDDYPKLFVAISLMTSVECLGRLWFQIFQVSHRREMR